MLIRPRRVRFIVERHYATAAPRSSVAVAHVLCSLWALWRPPGVGFRNYRGRGPCRGRGPGAAPSPVAGGRGYLMNE